MLNMITIITLLVFGFILWIGIALKWESNRKYKIKKILDSFVFISMYLCLVLICQNNVSREQWIYTSILLMATSLFNAYLSIYQLIIFSNLEKRHIGFGLMTLSFIVGVIFSFASIHYTLYFINPSWYQINSDYSASRVAFEFVYYVFSVFLTYGNEGITAIGILPKIIQMAQIIISFTFLGQVVITFFENKTIKQDKT